MWEQLVRDAGRVRLGRIRPFQGIHPTTTLAQELHILATANTSLGPGAGGFPHGQLPGKVGHRPIPLASLCCFTILCQIRFSDAACLFLLSRPFLVPIPHQSHPCPAAQQALLRFLPSYRHHLDDALEQRPTQLLASLLKTLHGNCRKPHSRLIPLPFTLPSTISSPPFPSPPDLPAVSFPVLHLGSL